MEKRSVLIHLFILGLALAWFGISVSSCGQHEYEGKILMVQGPANESGSGSEFVLFDPEDKKLRTLELKQEFVLMGSPDVSYDGERLLFEAKRNAGDPWVVWELHLSDSNLNRVTPEGSDCRYPAYLPDGRIVYSRYVKEQVNIGYHVLETCHPDGNDRKQITFDPVDYTNTHVLADGRLLCSAKEAVAEERGTRLMVMRPDGTKNELFYESDGLLISGGRAFENSRGLVFFSEKSEEEAEGKLVSVRYNHPMGSRDEAISDRAGDFMSASRGLNGQVMISFRDEKQGTYDLYTFEPGPEASLMPLYADPESNTLGAVLLEPRERPKKLPSAVNSDNETALLLCQDANVTGTGDYGAEKKAVRIQLLGVEGYLGEADLEQDGSVYLKVSADTPFRLQTLDEDGKLVQGPSSWINLRPNERRGCVGCHAGHERVPSNIQPLAVQKAPVEILNHHKSIIADAIKK